MHESIKGFPSNVDEESASSMKDQMAKLAAFQANVRAVRAAPHSERMKRAQNLISIHGIPPMIPVVALALLRLLRDSPENANDWSEVLDFIRKLPDELAGGAEVREQLALALSNTGKHFESIAELEALIGTAGPTPERLGLLGGRYKRQYQSAATPQDKLIYLNKSIQCYERGMDLDFNDYYCACNLPRLYRQRNRKGDNERSQNILQIVIAACERAKRRGVADEWLRPTLLGAAFDAGDADKAEEILDDVIAEGPTRWKLDSVLRDLEASATQVQDNERRERLTTVIAGLKSA